jgi:Beta-galactosidase
MEGGIRRTVSSLCGPRLRRSRGAKIAAARATAALLILLGFGLAAAPHSSADAEMARRPWQGFQVIMWQTKTAAQYEALRALGVTAAKVQVDRDGETPASASQKAAPITKAGLRVYVENIATDFYSAYHRWTPGSPPNWRFLALKSQLARDPADRRAFVRDPSLSDPNAIAKIAKRLTETVHVYSAYRPLFFNLGDETGIADLSAAWDFDFSKPSLAAMRIWLKQQYGTLHALNREWATEFRRWGDVVPSTTTEAMARKDENYASWADFKAWMDVAFARAIRDGTKAVHAGAPWARSAIEGAQMPGWGGYDYSQLASVLDVMEIYDAGNDLAIAQSFNPNLVFLTTSRWAGRVALHQGWQEFLRGTRGMVLWDPESQLIRPDGTVGKGGELAARFFREVHGGLGRVLTDSRAVRDPIAVLYSPASFRVQWMLDHRAMGPTWVTRDAAAEDEDDAVRAARRVVVDDLGQLGYAPRFVSDAQLGRGILRAGGYRVLVLPRTLALSHGAAGAIESYVRNGGRVIAYGATAEFDGHGRRLARPLLANLFQRYKDRAVSLPEDAADAGQVLERVLADVGLHPAVGIRNSQDQTAPRVKQYLFRRGRLMIAALLADPASNGEASAASRVGLTLRSQRYIYDVRTGAFLGHAQRIETEVRSQMPTVLAFASAPLSRAERKSLFGLTDLPPKSSAPHGASENAIPGLP